VTNAHDAVIDFKMLTIKVNTHVKQLKVKKTMYNKRAPITRSYN